MKVVRRTARVLWWLFLMTGIAAADLVDRPSVRYHLDREVGGAAGVILIMAGAKEFAFMAARPGWKWLHAILGVLFVGGGI
jgi:hypothetical protein